MYFQPQVNFLYKINMSSRLKYISRKSYGFCVFYQVLNSMIHESEISLTMLHNSILGNKPTILSLSRYIKASSCLYQLKTSKIKKNQKFIIINHEAVSEFKEIKKFYLEELEQRKDDFNHFFNEPFIISEIKG